MNVLQERVRTQKKSIIDNSVYITDHVYCGDRETIAYPSQNKSIFQEMKNQKYCHKQVCSKIANFIFLPINHRNT